MELGSARHPVRLQLSRLRPASRRLRPRHRHLQRWPRRLMVSRHRRQNLPDVSYTATTITARGPPRDTKTPLQRVLPSQASHLRPSLPIVSGVSGSSGQPVKADYQTLVIGTALIRQPRPRRLQARKRQESASFMVGHFFARIVTVLTSSRAYSRRLLVRAASLWPSLA